MTRVHINKVYNHTKSNLKPLRDIQPKYFNMSRLMSKPTKWHVRPAKTQISLGIRPVWSESSLSAWNLGPYATHWAHNEDSDQTGRMPRLIWVFAWRTCHFVGFVVRWLIYDSIMQIAMINLKGKDSMHSIVLFAVKETV